MKKNNLPVDLSIIPIIESGNNPQARSPKNALGLWQFMPATAKEWGLDTKTYKDDRKNVIKSTETAVNYLKYLHDQLQDWNLVLAAYNWGIGSVKKSMKSGLIVNGQIMLSRLPRETRQYIQRFHALKNLIKLNVANGDLNNYPSTDFVIKINRSDLDAYLEKNNLKNIDPIVMKHINGYDVFLNTNQSKVLVPTSAFQKLFSLKSINLKQPTKHNRSCSSSSYTAKYGDSLSKIGRRFNIKVDKLRDLNPNIIAIRPGMRIRLC